jgi:FkbM family methyltransferase
MEAPASFAQNGEDLLVWNYFERKAGGFFVEVGANHPTRLSQTWFLEQRGWSGILVEPLPACCDELRALRKNSRVVQAAAGAQAGQAMLNVAASDVWSHLGPSKDLQVVDRIPVAVRTLDDILAECQAPQVDFLSVDTEGMELDVLRGLNLRKHRPSLLLLEDHMDSLALYFYVKRQGYKLIKRTPPNNWWAPRDAPSLPVPLREWLSLWNLLLFRKPRSRMRDLRAAMRNRKRGGSR